MKALFRGPAGPFEVERQNPGDSCYCSQCGGKLPKRLEMPATRVLTPGQRKKRIAQANQLRVRLQKQADALGMPLELLIQVLAQSSTTVATVFEAEQEAESLLREEEPVLVPQPANATRRGLAATFKAASTVRKQDECLF